MKDTMKHLIIALAAILFATTGYAATSNHTEGDRVVVTRSVTADDTLALSGDVAKFRVYFISGCPSLTIRDGGDTSPCSGTPTDLASTTFDTAGSVKIGIVSLDDDCVSGGNNKRTSLTLTWVIDSATTTDTYNFSDDDERSAFWLTIFPDDTNAC